jgi:GntR family transcriptional regulator/MocR family aminotransferase
MQPSGPLIRSNSMLNEWTGLGPELFVRLDRDLPEPLGSQLQAALREAIRTGQLRLGDRLPSSRTLAHQLGVSRGLVVECYEQLEAEGYLNTLPGSATRVAEGTQRPLGPADRPVPPPRLAVDFRPGVPDLTSFPMRDWLWAIVEAGRGMPTAALGYGDARGSRELREVLAAYMRRVRAAAADPERMVVCSGFAQGINLILNALAHDGLTQLGLEDPGDRDNEAIARRAGLEPVPVPIDDEGVDVDALSATGVRAVLLTPAHQTPTGGVLAAGRRQALVAWAAQRDAIVIEDDYDAEFRYDRQPVGSLQGLAPDRVVSIGSASKALAPALRLAWIGCPPRVVESIACEKELADRGSPGLDQLALAKMMRSGRYDRHLRRMRSSYAARRGALVRAIARWAPDVELRGLAAGFHAVAHLPDALDEQTIIATARDRSIGLYGMSRYRSNGATRPTQLVLGFGNLNERSIEQGIAAIGDLLTTPRGAGRQGLRDLAAQAKTANLCV